MCLVYGNVYIHTWYIYVYHRGKYDIHIYASPEFSLNDLFVSPLIDAEVDAICDSNDCSFVTHLFSDLWLICLLVRVTFVFSFVTHASSHSLLTWFLIHDSRNLSFVTNVPSHSWLMLSLPLLNAEVDMLVVHSMVLQIYNSANGYRCMYIHIYIYRYERSSKDVHESYVCTLTCMCVNEIDVLVVHSMVLHIYTNTNDCR